MPIVKSAPYHIQAYELIKGMILSGEIKCGERINEIKLSQEMQISRSPIREAIRILEQDGLIVSTSNSHIVNPLDRNTLQDVYECRIGLESYAARLAVKNFTKEDYDKLVQSVEDCKIADRNDDLIALIDLNTFFHSYIVSLTKNEYIISEMERIRNIVTLSRIKEVQDGERDLSYAYSDHLEIAKKMLEGDEDSVEHFMRKHISNNLSKLIL